MIKVLIRSFIEEDCFMIPEQIKTRLQAIAGAENYDDSKAGRLVYSYDATPSFNPFQTL